MVIIGKIKLWYLSLMRPIRGHILIFANNSGSHLNPILALSLKTHATPTLIQGHATMV